LLCRNGNFSNNAAGKGVEEKFEKWCKRVEEFINNPKREITEKSIVRDAENKWLLGLVSQHGLLYSSLLSVLE